MTDASAGALLGIDAGNTKTIALVASPDGTILGSGRALGCADIHAVPEDEALRIVGTAIDAAIGMVAAEPRTDGDRSPPLRRAAFSMAGADWPEDLDELRTRLGVRWPDPVVVNDAIGALRAAIPDGPGVVVVGGTGVATGARGLDGRLWHSSFWQEPQGAHELGVRALHAVYRSELGIDPPTTLTPAVLDVLGAPDVETVLHRQSRRGAGPWRGARMLAPLLLDAAEAGDAAAIAVVEEHGRALGRMAAAAARRVGIEDGSPFDLALAGGLFRHPGTRLRDAVLAAVRVRAPGVREVVPELEPAVGAL
ncbi:MAG TPA: BadF/BadG/BcrA/BcrD ATPase family protein, partial [Candidatus Limnocylindrales bacterium]|nr:BadF/BadG/BcrA/BcrD ATPase family protein [Candidatus Limnocylindrales bacterium]